MQESPINWVMISSIGSILTPLLLLLLSALGWKYKQSFERKIKSEEWLRDDRIETYNNILEPYVIMLMTDVAWESEPDNKDKDKWDYITKKVLSLEYRKNAFKLSLIGTDAVYSAYCDLMQNSFASNESDNDDDTHKKSLHTSMSLLGNFLLEIRKSMGNESTKLDNWKMLEWFITDIKTYKLKF